MGWDGGFSAAVGADLLRGRVGEPHQVINTEIRSPRGGRYHLIPHTPIVHCTCECTRSFSYYSQKFLLGSRGLQVIFKILEIARDSKGGDYQTISFWRFFSKKFNHCIALGKGGYTKTDEFLEKFQKGGGGHFQSKNLCCRFLPL